MAKGSRGGKRGSGGAKALTVDDMQPGFRGSAMVAEWVLEREQAKARGYNIFFDAAERTDMGTPVRENGFENVKIREVLSVSDKAIRVEISSGDVIGSAAGWKVWIPKSQIRKPKKLGGK